MHEDLTMHLPLQFFAEGGEPTPGENAPEGQNTEPPAQTEKTFTQDEVNKIVSERVKAEQKRLEKKFADEAAEAAKVASMDAEQKAKHEAEMREKALSDREAQITKRELAASARDILAEKGLPVSLAAVLDCTSEESCNASMEVVEKAFKEAVEKAVNNKMRGDPPKLGAAASPKGGNLSAKNLI